MWLYGFTTLLSAFLVFQVQMLLAKYILPWHGGVPAVWTTCMLFFQVALLLGYGYAHWLAIRPRLAWQRNIHLALVALSLAVLAVFAVSWQWPLLPDASWRPQGAASPIGHILLLLTAAVGIPFVTLSATAPLLQRWFSLTHPGQSPYRLYALSNVGSLAGLLGYPFLVEVFVPLRLQAALWTAAYTVFAAVMAGAAIMAARRGAGAHAAGPAAAPDAAGARPGPMRVLTWFGLAACASALLLAITNQMSQEIAVVPFLWVLPLALYLLSFVLCFAGERWYPRGLYLPLLVAALVLVTLAVQRGVSGPLAPQIALYAAALFVTCMVCHGELVRLKPSPRHLTAFYLTLSAGGAAGGVFVGILAPLYFLGYWELSIALVATVMLVALVLYQDPASPLRRGRPASTFVPLLASVLLVVYVYAEQLGVGAGSLFEWLQQRPSALVVAALAALLFYSLVRRRLASFAPSRPDGAAAGTAWRHAALAGAIALFAAVHYSFIQDSFGGAVAVSRNFFGILNVRQSVEDDESALYLRHGRTIHGLQFLSRARRTEPTTYYTPPSGIGQVLRRHARRLAGKPLRVGIVGLGVGTLAAYGRPGDRFRFYEIDPDVVRLAAGPEALFTYVRHSGAGVEIVLGDARVSLEREPSQRFDVLAIDAFSSGSIPVHLLTREALALYFTHLEPQDGVLALHVTNRYLDLVPVVATLAHDLGLALVAIRHTGQNDDWPNDWLLLARRAGALPAPGPRPAALRRGAWTDDYSNLLQAIRWTRHEEPSATNSMESLGKEAEQLDLAR